MGGIGTTGASDEDVQLIVQTMEAWFHGDKEALAEYYGTEFRANALRPNPSIEEIPKDDLFQGLKNATRDCPKGEYSKGRHSFEILARIDPGKVRNCSPHAERLLAVMDRLCD